MMKLVIMFLVIFALTIATPFTIAHTETSHSDFSDIQPLLDNPVDCSQLSDEQLERLGDYYMDLMHPGEEHEVMDEMMMMGGDGSESLKQMHIQMGEGFYCDATGTDGMMGPGMMVFDEAYPGMMHGYWWVYPLAVVSVIFAVIIIYAKK
jgi:hypothetical protein